MPLTIQQWDEIARETNSKKMKLTFSDGTIIQNDKIVAEQMSLEESLCSEENLRYGCCESSCFQIRIAYTNKSFVGLTVDVEMEYPPQWFTLVNDIGETIVDQDNVPITTFDEAEAEEGYKAVFGTFRVISDKPTNDRKYRDLICYDLMYDILHANVIDWFENVTFPISLKNLRDSFFTSLGIEQVSTTLINDNFMVQGAIEASYELSGRSIIESICEFNATFGHMRSDGKFEYISLPTGNSVTYPYYVDGSGAYADYVTETITGLTAVNAQGDSGTFVGTSEDNLYIMQSNLMTFGAEGTQDLQTALTNVLTQISAFTYRPFDVTVYGNPMLPLGTAIVLNTKYQTINSFVMNKYMSGIQALRDHLSAVGEQTYPSDVNRIKNEIIRSTGKIHKITNDVNELTSEIYDDQGKSLIQQTLNEIVLKVDSNGKLVKVALGDDATLGSTFTIDADYINITSDTIEFDNSGYKVKGDVYTTIINPDNHIIETSYVDVPYSEYFINRRSEMNEFIKRAMDYTFEYTSNSYKIVTSPGQSYETTQTIEGALDSYNYISLKSANEVNTNEGNIGDHVTGTALNVNIGIHLALYDSMDFVLAGGRYKSVSGLDAQVLDFSNYDVSITPFNECITKAFISVQKFSSYKYYYIKVSEYLDYIHQDDEFTVVTQDIVNLGGAEYLKVYQPYTSVLSVEHGLTPDSSYGYWCKTYLIPHGGGTPYEVKVFSLNDALATKIDDWDGVCKSHLGNSWAGGYIMHGRDSLAHKYTCIWTNSQLQFWVDVTNVGHVSDRRLKEDIEEVNPNLVKAICECKTYQYKAFNRNGLISVGIIAQDFVANCEKYGIDPMDYEVCQKSIFKADDDTEYYYIEYSQYLTLKSIHLQNQIDELKELIKK